MLLYTRLPDGKLCSYLNNLYYGDTQNIIHKLGRGVEYITWNVTGRNDTLASIINYNSSALLITPTNDTESSFQFIWQYRSQTYAFVCALNGNFSRATQQYTDLLNTRFRNIVMSLPSDVVYPLDINVIIFS